MEVCTESKKRSDRYKLKGWLVQGLSLPWRSCPSLITEENTQFQSSFVWQNQSVRSQERSNIQHSKLWWIAPSTIYGRHGSIYVMPWCYSWMQSYRNNRKLGRARIARSRWWHGSRERDRRNRTKWRLTKQWRWW